jgi:hypothetical protein
MSNLLRSDRAPPSPPLLPHYQSKWYNERYHHALSRLRLAVHVALKFRLLGELYFFV